MPNYFADYDTTVTFVTAEELAAKHSGIPHGGQVIRRGTTSEGVHATIGFELALDSNPEFTGAVLVAVARAVARMAERGETGARTVFDVTLTDLSPGPRRSCAPASCELSGGRVGAGARSE